MVPTAPATTRQPAPPTSPAKAGGGSRSGTPLSHPQSSLPVSQPMRTAELERHLKLGGPVVAMVTEWPVLARWPDRRRGNSRSPSTRWRVGWGEVSRERQESAAMRPSRRRVIRASGVAARRAERRPRWPARTRRRLFVDASDALGADVDADPGSGGAGVDLLVEPGVRPWGDPGPWKGFARGPGIEKFEKTTFRF